jgi:hypothetical protein
MDEEQDNADKQDEGDKKDKCDKQDAEEISFHKLVIDEHRVSSPTSSEEDQVQT